MIKSLGVLLGGIFVGAAGAEILRTKSPKVMENICTKACGMTSGVVDAFKTGYKNATQPQPAAEPAS